MEEGTKVRTLGMWGVRDYEWFVLLVVDRFLPKHESTKK